MKLARRLLWTWHAKSEARDAQAHVARSLAKRALNFFAALGTLESKGL